MRPHKIMHTIKDHIRPSMTTQYHSRLFKFKTLKDPKGRNNYILYETIPGQTKPYVKLELVPFREGNWEE